MVWERTLKIVYLQPLCPGQGHLHQIKLLRAPSNLNLNTSRNRAAKTSLGNLHQGLTTLTKEFSSTV